MNFLTRITNYLFGGGKPIQRRDPVPLSKSEAWLAYSCLVFLIAVAAYIPTRVWADRAYCENKKEAVFEKCVLSTKDFNWCWINLTP